MESQRCGGPFDHLEYIGVVEPESLVLALDLSGSDRKVGDTARLLTLLKVIRDRYLTIRFDSFFPETMVDLHGGGRYGSDRIIALFLLADSSAWGGYARHPDDAQQTT